jgi:molybdenum transport protein
MQRLNDGQLLALLADDVPFGDLNTLALGMGGQAAHLSFAARQAMTVAGSEEAARLFELAGARSELLAPSGSALQPGGLILQAHGPAAALHCAWKAAQTLVEWASGISTATAAVVLAPKGTAVACTRKTAPGTKAMSVKAVLAGGGSMHRLFLHEAPAQTIARQRSSQPEKKIVVEVADQDEALSWADVGADVLQLEKFTPEALALCRQAIDARPGRRPLLAAAGGVRAENAAAYVAAGADFLVTSSPYAAPPRDVQVQFRRAP